MMRQPPRLERCIDTPKLGSRDLNLQCEISPSSWCRVSRVADAVWYGLTEGGAQVKDQATAENLYDRYVSRSSISLQWRKGPMVPVGSGGDE